MQVSSSHVSTDMNIQKRKKIWNNNQKSIARIISEYAHSKTSIDIHPACIIDESFAIDHGVGVVIGETCKIGKNVRLYHNVTLGAKSLNNIN